LNIITKLLFKRALITGCPKEGYMIYIGIDPGKSGGISCITDRGEERILVNTSVWDDEHFIGLCNGLRDKQVKAVVEKVGAMPGQGVTSMFNFGRSFGYILGVLEACDISYELVPPQKWKKEFSVTADKESSIKAAKRLFPNINLKRTERCTKDHDGMAEALLMAEYARRHMK
jgi:hypothetical protein